MDLFPFCVSTPSIVFLTHLFNSSVSIFPKSSSSSSSSSSCRATSMDFPDPLSPLFSIVHRSRQVSQATSCISTELLSIGSCWSSNLCSSMWGGPQEDIVYELVLTSPAVSHISDSSNLDSFRDGWYSCSYVVCCLQDLINTVGSILVSLISSFFSIRLVVYMLHP